MLRVHKEGCMQATNTWMHQGVENKERDGAEVLNWIVSLLQRLAGREDPADEDRRTSRSWRERCEMRIKSRR